ncbi:hypothetical protein AAVH_19664 [Aphelenchoides avenae]|nr:hypothetical protein AAVH_19664 [Aphelenchus avenae]
MSAPNSNNVGGPRQVTCVTSDKDHIVVDIDVLLVCHTFSKMDISSEVFKKVIAWCKEHKGLPEPVIEKDAFTQAVKWLALTPYEQQFLERSGPIAAIAALVKGKSTAKVRLILRQHCVLITDDITEIYDQSSFLEERLKRDVRIEEPIYWPEAEDRSPPEVLDIPVEVLVTILKKLPRADIERFQLASYTLYTIILDNQKPLRKLSEERGPLRLGLGVPQLINGGGLTDPCL